MYTINVNTKSHTYPIYIDSGLIENSELLKRHLCSRQVMIVSNETVAPLYLDKVQQSLKGIHCDTVILPDGEQYKTIETLNLIFNALLEKKHHRSTTLIALGGGVIGDMTGFAAACYQRGVGFIQMPTSLLAQVDASVGGKTAVNHPMGKNMIGAFHQPQCVIIDTQTLTTLPKRELSAGLAEVIKHGLIKDETFFTWLESNMEQILNKYTQALQHTIAKCCEIKAQVVTMDERETGIRAILNFGHTIGHAIEAGMGYGVLLHGEAVAIGMIAAANLSAKLGYLSQDDVNRIKNCVKCAHLPTKINGELTIDSAKSLMSMDKKVLKNNIRFILLKKIGESFITSDINENLVNEVLMECGFVTHN